MPHPILSRLSALQFAWLAFWIFAIGLAVADRRLRETDSLIIIGGVMVAAALAAAAVYLATSAPLHRRGAATNWTTFLLVTATNLALTAALVALATS
jgi:hypothetical protein